MRDIIKRDGSIVSFDEFKIINAIEKAFLETDEQYDIDNVMLPITSQLVSLDGDCSVEDIQDVIEHQLMQQGFFKTAKKFILYRENKTKNRIPNILKQKTEYITEYPQIIEFCKKQEEKFWTSDEIDVEKDIQDLRVNMTESERHGVITVLKLFTQYELHVGGEYWGGRFKETFKRPEFERMASTFSFFELGVHAPFYAKINQALFIDTEEFYNEYKHDSVLAERMEFISNALNDPDILYSLAVFAMLEGAVLYSSFAFLKHFQSNGKNLIANICAGINFSVRDELIHHEAGCYVFRTLVNEYKLSGIRIDPNLNGRIQDAAILIFSHERQIINKIFEKGKITNVSKYEMYEFVQHRINECLINLNIDSIYKIDDDTIKNWFYKGIDSYIFHDFFAKQGREYTRNWNEKKFTWSKT